MLDGDGTRLKALQQENLQLRRAVDELVVLKDLASAIAGQRDPDEIMQTITHLTVRTIQAEQGVITLVAERTQDPMRTLVRKVASSSELQAMRPDQMLLGWMQIHKNILLIEDPRQDERFKGIDWDPTIHSILCVPLMVKSRLIGMFTLYNKRGQSAFHASDGRLVSIIAAQFAQVIENARLHEERDRILQIFGQHASPEIVEEVLSKGADTSSRRIRVCIMFLDIRGFTSFSEHRPPEEVVAFLNTLFDFTIEQVNRHHGIIDRLLGDGFLALFGVPFSHGNDSLNAVRAALDILERVDAACSAGLLPPIRIGIGLHTGEVVVGMVGSTIHKEYEVTGDAVNLASRIEGMNKEYASQILISESVWKEIEAAGVQATPLGPVVIRGRTDQVHLYRIA